MTELKHRWSVGHNYMTGITFGAWLRLLAQNKFHISPAYLHRAAVITGASIGNSAFAAIENLRFGRQVAATEITKQPLFILGHWRSGTTHLHDLIAQDTAQFQYANTFQVVNPLTFLTTENTLTRLMAGMLPDKRPMDNMALAFTSPQEDEFAPLLMTLYSVYLGSSFPQTGAQYDRHLTFRDAPAHEVQKWQDALRRFCQKLTLNDPRSLVLKSPPHTARVKMLLDVFPDARFVHIHRDPYSVFQSMRHFFDTAGWYTYLQRPDVGAIDDGILRRYVEMYDAFFDDMKLIPKGRFHEVRFADLEADPIGQVAQIYDALSLENFTGFQPTLQTYVDSLKGYKKNSFEGLNAVDRAKVAATWQRNFDRWGYPK